MRTGNEFWYGFRLYSVAMKANKTVTVCVNYRANPDAPSCGARGGVEIAEALEAAVVERGLPVAVERFNCLGMGEHGPNLKFSPGGEFCQALHLEDLPQLLEKITAFAKDLGSWPLL